jgi:hypothetical protein
VNNVCKDASHRGVMHQKLACFQKSGKDFDSLTSKLMADMSQVQGLESKDRKNAYCCLLEEFYERFTNVSTDGCKSDNWQFLESIMDPLIVDLPEAICEVSTGAAVTAASPAAAAAASPTLDQDHCAGMAQTLAAAKAKNTKTSPDPGSMAILPFLLQLMSQ